MRHIATLLVAILMGACSAGSPGTTLLPAQADSLIQAKAKDSTFLLLDIRTPQEYAMGHIAGSRLIDFYAPDFEAQIAKLPRKAPILMYCRSSNRSGKALEMMKSMGFQDVRHLSGGIISWQAEARPLTKQP